MIEVNGGVYSPKVTDSCTHLISTQKEVDNNGTKSRFSLIHLPDFCRFFG